jgi:adenosylhomocysteine nucleosidase
MQNSFSLLLGSIVLVICNSPLVSQSTALVSRPVTVLVVTAVDYEFAAVSSLLTSPRKLQLSGRQAVIGEYAGSHIAVIRTGWGKAQASGAAAVAIRFFKPRLVVMAGVGGGIDNSNISSGDVILVRSTFQYDLGKLSQSELEIWPPETPQEKPYPSPSFDSSITSFQIAAQAAQNAHFVAWTLPATCSCEKDGTLKPGCTAASVRIDRIEPRVCSGTVASGDAFLVDTSLAERLVANRDVEAVDMETAAVAEEASNANIPFLGVRVVADTVNGSNEDLYYCLKPFSGPRLKEVMDRILSGLAQTDRVSQKQRGDKIASCRGTDKSRHDIFQPPLSQENAPQRKSVRIR